ncbi:MAG: ROK family transcriptional regulator [Sphaerochaeta sp.]|nr:ROK family transcriptional regulator [Sphaerochaeta sp.]
MFYYYGHNMQSDDLEFINCQNVLHAIERDLTQPSRAQIAKHVGLSRTAVSLIVTRLINAGLVKELDRKVKGRGRPGIPLVIDDSHWHAIGATFYSGTWIFVIVNLSGHIITTHKMSVFSTEQDALVETLIEGLAHMRSICPPNMLPGLGIGSPGLVDHKTGAILRADDLGWHEVLPLKRIVEERTGLPVFILNRYRANGLAEIRYGNHNKSPNIIYIGIGTGIAGSIYLDKQLINTTNYRLGHMVIDPHGPRCGCGQAGCLQAMASEGALLKFARKQMGANPGFLKKTHGETLTGKVIAELAEQGDPDACSCIDHISDPIAIGVSTLANVIAPNEIILGGPLGDASSYLVDRVRERVHSYLLDWQNKDIAIIQGTQGDYGSAIGAATSVLDKKLELVMDGYCHD